MKVGILTFHNAFNYGAVLQAYATQELIKSHGYEVEVIDYHNKAIDRHYNLRKFHFGSFFKRIHKFPLYLIEEFFYWKRRNNYRAFFAKNMKLSSKRYIQGESFSFGDYDLVLIGSDQLWNKKLTGGLDEVYWGQFDTSCHTRKVTWSICMNDISLTEIETQQIKNYIKNFTAISVREDDLKTFITKMTNKIVFHTLDPTLLLPPTKWEHLCHPVKEKNYIAVYAVRKEKETIIFARKIAADLNKKIIIIRSYSKWYYSAENKEYCGPEDFLSYLRFADFVVTSSFHGTVFSIVFQRQFVCPVLEGNVRVNDLLCTVGLAYRMISQSQDVLSLPSIDYSNLSDVLDIKRNESLNFLKKVLND